MFFEDKFSPYLDDEPISEFFDDVGGRGATAFGLAVLVHIGLFVFLQSQGFLFEAPEKPKPIQIEIISFEPEKQKDTPQNTQVTKPVEKTPATAPRIRTKPKPKPKPAPKPVPKPEPKPIPPAIQPAKPAPKPIPKVEPKPKSKPAIAPTPPPTIKSKTQTPTTQIAPPTVPQPVQPPPKPDVSKPVVPKDIPAPLPPQPKPMDPFFEPVEDAQDLDETVLDIDSLPDVPSSSPKPLPPAPVERPKPVPGFASSDVPKDDDLDPILDISDAPLPETISAKPKPVEAPKPVETPPESPVVTTAPSILASPDAPSTAAEKDIAVPKSQSTPLDVILKGRPGALQTPTSPRMPGRAGNRPGGGNESNIPIGGGTSRPRPGAGGWTLSPEAYGNEGKGKGRGVIKDIRCREQDRTHLDCPEYMPKYQGRRPDGFETFGAHVPRGTTITANSPSRGIVRAPTGGPTDDNSGNPTPNLMEDANLPPLNPYRAGSGVPQQPGRLRDIFGNPDPEPWTEQGDIPPPPEEDDTTILLKKRDAP